MNPLNNLPSSTQSLGWTRGTGANLLFRVWAPMAKVVKLHLYDSATAPQAKSTMDLKPSPQNDGTWETTMPMVSDQYYTVEYFHEVKGSLTSSGEWPDPYARAAGPQGSRGWVYLPGSRQPPGWEKDQALPHKAQTEAVVWELHIRDLSSKARERFSHPGTFLSLAEPNICLPGTQGGPDFPIGLDYLVSLGVTHVHLLPVFDFDGTDDLLYRADDYNWGYNPRNYNVLKAAYSSNPHDPGQVIQDFKSMVAALHRRGIGVVLDMVYNHTFAGVNNALYQSAPAYWHRMISTSKDLAFSNGSGCGNEVASEHPMVQRYILDSLQWFVDEFHVDGFRFDLMGLMDINTINLIVERFKTKNPGFLLYGEGWTGGPSTLPSSNQAIKANASKTPGMGYFSDDFRDVVKGHVFENTSKGFVNGALESTEALPFSVAGASPHPQVATGKDPRQAWALHPDQTVNYVAAHDNHTLWDKLALTNPLDDVATRIRMHKLANAMVFTSQGMAFLHAGEEFLRSKSGDENSYKSSDEINGLDWERARDNLDTIAYYRGLIELRRSHKAFTLKTAQELAAHLVFLETQTPGLLAFALDGHAGGDRAESILVVYNANRESRRLTIPHRPWQVVVDGNHAGTRVLYSIEDGSLEIEGICAMVLMA